MHAAISASAAPVASGHQGFPVGGLGPVQQPADLTRAPRGLPSPLVGKIPQQVGGGRDPALLLGDQRHPLAHPGIFYEFPRLALERGQDGADRHPHAGHHRLGVGVDEPRELITVATAERAHLDR